MIRRPPRSTLFPTRRSSDLTKIQGLLFSLDELNQSLMMNFRGAYLAFATDPCGNARYAPRKFIMRLWLRSEEHTSELQSLRHLVCRLLLEKKKIYKNVVCGF